MIQRRPVGVLRTDESGEDAKLVAVPHQAEQRSTITSKCDDLPELLKAQIPLTSSRHYKDWKKGKWVKS